MHPNDYQNQPGNPASLPAVPIPVPPQPPAGAAPVRTLQPAADDVSARVASQAKQLISQYGGDPYKLSEALNQLKAGYLAEQYHIMTNQVEN